MTNRRRVATTWDPDQDPDLEAYIAAHSDNISAALRRAIREGIRRNHDIMSLLEELVQGQAEILSRLNKTEVVYQDGSVTRLSDTTESGISVEQLPGNILDKLKGFAKG